MAERAGRTALLWTGRAVKRDRPERPTDSALAAGRPLWSGDETVD
jgi:hypothetical protein